ncbi:MAG: peptidoglycan D,D-transpeptidase FtsI family protein [Verrucomicrobium sp.]|nr:penicillin-binding transpeptidase domain-containing protein [Verrucomicrobium sp.]
MSFLPHSLVAFLGLPVALLSTVSTASAGPLPQPQRGEILDRNGVTLATSSPPAGTTLATAFQVRYYPLGILAGHTLGYAKPVPAKDRDEGEDNDNSRAIRGIQGTEKAYDSDLSGTLSPDGKSTIHGNDIYLTLDSLYQAVVEQSLQKAAIKRGAAILMDPNNGDILAMTSLPPINPNDFTQEITQERLNTYLKNPAKPLINRAIYDRNPGSTFMLVTALAGALSGQESASYRCDGRLEVAGKTFSCWITAKDSTHGNQTVDQALTHGCGLYFYGLAQSMGYQQIVRTSELLGLQGKAGTGLPDEGSGFIPATDAQGSQLLHEKYPHVKKLTPPALASISVGHGLATVTPLQMTMVAGTIANGGTVWKPRLLDRVQTPNSKELRKAPQTILNDLRQHGLSESGLDRIRKGMRDRSLKILDSHPESTGNSESQIFGVNGTVQIWAENLESREMEAQRDAWFVGYVLVDDKPKWALTVMVQGSKREGPTAIPIAQQIIHELQQLSKASK